MDQDDGNLEHFNQMLKDVVNSKIYGDITRVDKLTEEDRSMLIEEGFPFHIIDQMINNKEYGKSHVRITKADGTKVYGEMDALKQIQGYNDYADATELARQKVSQEINTLAVFGYTGTNNNLEALRRTIVELPGVEINDQKFQDKLTENMQIMAKEGQREQRPFRETNEAAYATRAMEDLGIDESDPSYNGMFNDFIAEHRNLIKPSKVKQLEIGQKAQEELQDMKFLSMNTESISEDKRFDIETKIQKIEKLSGYELDNNTKKELLRIRGLAHLGDKAGELTSAETGLLDNLWFGVKKYIFDEAPPGTDAAAAYALYRNMARHAQFGSVLPAGEIKSFAEAFGSMGMQIGPVLTMLRESLIQLKHNYDAVAEMENPYVIKWRTGMGAIGLDDTINKLDERISMIDIIAKDLPFSVIPQNRGTTKTVATPEQQAILDEIYENRR